MNDATPFHRIPRLLRWAFVPLVVACALLVPAEALGQTCYAEADGDWSNTNIWAPTDGGDPTQNCDGGDGLPGSGETAVITSGFSVNVASNTTVGTLTIKDGAGGVFLNGGDLTVEGAASVGETTSPGTATLNTFVDDDESDLSGDASGKLTVGELTVFGDVKVFRESGSDGTSPDNGELEVTDANAGNGDFTIESSGEVIGGPFAPANQVGGGTFSNSGTITSQRCYAGSFGNWTDNTIWAPIGGTDASLTCDNGGNADGVPNASNETAVTNAFLSVASNVSVGFVEAYGDFNGFGLSNADLTIANDLTVGEVGSGNTPSVQTYEDGPGGDPIQPDGKLTVNGSIVVNTGDLSVARDGDGTNDTGELEVNATNGSGNVTLESAGALRVNQLGSGSGTAPISIGGDLSNNSGDINIQTTDFAITGDLVNSGSGTVTLNNGSDLIVNTLSNEGSIKTNGGNISLLGTNSFDTSVNGPGGTSATIDTGGGTIDSDNSTFTNEENGTLTTGTGDLKIRAGLDLNGTYNRSTSSSPADTAEVIFNGPGGPQTLKGETLDFLNLVVKDGATVDPNDVEQSNDLGDVKVLGDLKVEQNATFGEGSGTSTNENADLNFQGPEFDIKGNLFADQVNFSGADGTNEAKRSMTVSGSIVATAVLESNVIVNIGASAFTVVGLVQVKNGTSLDLNGSSLTFNGDVLLNGDLVTDSGGTINFNGEGRTTDCFLDGSDLKCSSQNDVQEVAGSGGTIDFPTLRVLDDLNNNDDGNTTAETKLQFSDSSTDYIVKGGFTVDEADFTSGRPLELQGDLTVQNNAAFSFTNQATLKFGAGSDQSIDAPSGLSVSSILVDKSGGTATILNNLTASDSLKLRDGNLAPGSGANITISNKLVLGSENETATATLDLSNGTATLAAPDGHVRYVDSDGNDDIDADINGDLIVQRQTTQADSWFYLSAPADEPGSNDTFSDFLENGTSTDYFIRGVTGGDKNQENNVWATVELWDEADPTTDDPAQSWKEVDCSDNTNCSTSGLDVSNGTLSYPVSDITTDPMMSGRGYSVYVYNDEDNDGNPEGSNKVIDSRVDPLTGSGSTSFNFATDGPGLHGRNHDGGGWANTYDPQTLSGKAEGFNLLGNPYLATIDICSVYNDAGGTSEAATNNINSNIYVWSPGDGDNVGIDCSTESTFGPDDGLEGGWIAPHQGFMVQITGSSPQLAINDITAVQKDSTEDFFRKSAAVASDGPRAINLELNFDGHRYRTAVGFVEGRKLGKDANDAAYSGYGPASSSPSIYSVLDDGNALVSNGLPRSISDETTVSLALDACDGTVDPAKALSGQAQISWPMVKNIPSEWAVTLKDTETGESVNLKSATQYTFTHQGECPSTSKSNSKSTSTETTDLAPRPTVGSSYSLPVTKNGNGPDTRFELVIDPDGGSGSGGGSGDDDSGSDDESNPDDATIELGVLENESSSAKLSTSGLSSTVQFQHKFRGGWKCVPLSGFGDCKDDTAVEDDVSAYAVNGDKITIDKTELEAGTHRYRLDSSTKSSDDGAVEINVERTTLTTYPNPLSQGQATVEFVTNQDANVTVTLYNTLGQKVRILHRGPVDAGDTETADVNAQSLASGIYFVRMRGDGVMATTRMTIVK
jgi:hypothetical protein